MKSNAVRTAGMRFTHDYAEFFDLCAADAAAVAATRIDFVTLMEPLLEKLGVGRDHARLLAEDLWQHMSRPGRHYHTAVHILAMFHCADRLGIELTDIQQLAVWYHDAIYDVEAQPGENEFRSAQWMKQVLAPAGIPAAIIDSAAQMILWTAHHLDHEVPPSCRTLMDLDLSGLASRPDVFSRQSQAVRNEMAHLSDEQYSRVTIGFFRMLLERPHLYRTDQFAPLEPIAREQVNREILRLALHAPSSNGKH
jgi:predicted metal-dependent HD superfamily phosphohydrolase